MLEIKKLEINLKKFKLKAENINLYSGEKIVLYAQNNSGKSILLLGLTGLIRTKARELFFNKIHCKEDTWQEYTGVYHDQSSLVPFLTPIEFFKMTGELKGIPKEFINRDAMKYCEYLRLPKENKYIKDLSLGTQKKVGLIASLLGNPSVILWDEPFENLDDESSSALAIIFEAELKNSLVLLTSPTEELAYKTFTSRLSIEDGVVKHYALTLPALVGNTLN